jgi:hypothetical protein
MRRLVGTLMLLGVLAAPLAVAQEDTTARIIVEGDTTSVFPVANLAFRFEARVDTVNDTAATAKVLTQIKDKLKSLLQDAEPGPGPIKEGPITLPADQAAMGWSVWVRYPAPVFHNAIDPEEQFGTFVQRIRNLGKQAGCRVLGPFFEPADREVHEQETIARATEQALYKAEAAARVLRTRIYTVEKIEVLEIEWFHEAELAPDKDEPVASVRGVPCRARVKVTYVSAAG